MKSKDQNLGLPKLSGILFHSLLSLLFVFLVTGNIFPDVRTIEEVKVGMTAAMSGPNQYYGQNMKIGIEAYFKKANRQEVIPGKKMVLIVMDDGYVAELAGLNMKHLLEKENVLAVIGNVGTSMAQVTVPIANHKRTLLFGAFSGGRVLRKSPPDRYVINYRTSYAQETAAMIKGIIDVGIRPHEIAFFSQDDSFGDDGYNGAILALKTIGFQDAHLLAHGRYTPNTIDIEEGLITILEAKNEPRAIIMISAHSASAKFIRIAHRVLPHTLFLNVSAVASEAFIKALGQKGDGVIITQVVPHYNSDLPICKEYLTDLAACSPIASPGFVSLEGYIVAKIFCQGIPLSMSNLTREGIIQGIECIHNLDIGIGVPINLNSSIHQAVNMVWPTMIRGSELVSITWKDLKTLL